jgi:hypothetical protein
VTEESECLNSYTNLYMSPTFHNIIILIAYFCVLKFLHYETNSLKIYKSANLNLKIRHILKANFVTETKYVSDILSS